MTESSNMIMDNINTYVKENVLDIMIENGQMDDSTRLKFEALWMSIDVQVGLKNCFMSTRKQKKFGEKTTNETLGMTCEKILCDIYQLEYQPNMSLRSSERIYNKYYNTIKDFLDKEHIRLIKFIGSQNNHIDFILENNKTLSLKTTYNINNKICPQNIGQTTRKKFDLYFNINCSDDYQRKLYIIKNIKYVLTKYYENLFSCDYLLWLYLENQNIKYKYLNKLDFVRHSFNISEFSFTRTAEKWSESTTVKIDNISIGEFQLHKNRDNVKFRFIMKNLLLII